MAERSAIDVWNRRLPVYSYVESLVAGKRVLEVGSGIGLGADFLAARGAAVVTAVDSDAGVIERARARYRRANLEFLLAPDLATVGGAEGSFDVIVVPDGEELLRRPVALAEWKRLLGGRGRLVVAVPSADRRGSVGGLGYYEIKDSLGPLFPSVRLFGQTPFLGFGLAEFDGAAEGLRVESGLVDGGTEEPTHYLAVAGPEGDVQLGYALIQIPFAPFEARLVRAGASRPDTSAAGAAPAELARLPELEGQVARLGAEARLFENRAMEAERRLAEAEARVRNAGGDEGGRAALDNLRREHAEAVAQRDVARAQLAVDRGRADEAEARLGEVRRKLEDALAQADAASRVARAQGEEIEELRGRLRRGADDRSELEAEVAKLRKGLAQADESVANLTRRTAEEMESLMQRLAAGLRSQAEADALRDRAAEVGAAREEIARLRTRLVETEARCEAAERRLEGASAAEVQSQEHQARLAQAERATEAARTELADTAGRLRAAEEEIAGLSSRLLALGERDQRIARLEVERQEALWRAEAAEATLRDFGPVLTAGARTDELEAAVAARDAALVDFRKAAAAHVEEATRLRTAVADQGALVIELEEALSASEARARAAESNLEGMRKSLAQAEEADRARRSRLAEVEGKLLRLSREAEMRASQPALDPEAEQKMASVTRERDELRRIAEVTRLEIDEMRAALDRGEEQLWQAKEQILEARERVGQLEADAAAVQASRDDAERARQAAVERVRALEDEVARVEAARAVSESAARSQLESSAAAEAQDRLRRIADVLARLQPVEDAVRAEIDRLVELERLVVAAAVEARHGGSELLVLRQSFEAKEQELQGALMELDNVRTQAQQRLAEAEAESERRLTIVRQEADKRIAATQAEIDGIRDLQVVDLGGGGKPAAAEGDKEAEVILLHTTIANHRRRASKLREEIDGYRARAGRLSADEVAGLLEEIREDLTQFDK